MPTADADLVPAKLLMAVTQRPFCLIIDVHMVTVTDSVAKPIWVIVSICPAMTQVSFGIVEDKSEKYYKNVVVLYLVVLPYTLIIFSCLPYLWSVCKIKMSNKFQFLSTLKI